MEKLNKTVHIAPQFTSSDWELYDADDFALNVDVAGTLNAQLAYFVNSGFDRKNTEKRMRSLMHSFRDYGAADTEPAMFLERVLDRIYGR